MFKIIYDIYKIQRVEIVVLFVENDRIVKNTVNIILLKGIVENFQQCTKTLRTQLNNLSLWIL